MSAMELNLLGQAVLGYVWQWLRAIKNIPNWASWAVAAVASAGVYVFVTKGFGEAWQADWRAAVAGMLSFILAARGTASTSSETGIAKPTNSL